MPENEAEDVAVDSLKVNALLGMCYSWHVGPMTCIATLLAAIELIDKANRLPDSKKELSEILKTLLDDWKDLPNAPSISDVPAGTA